MPIILYIFGPKVIRRMKQLVIHIIIANKLSFVYVILVRNVITLKILLKVLMETTNTIMRVHLVMDTFDIFTHSLPQACNFVHFPTT